MTVMTMIRRTVSCVFISAIAAVIMLCFFTASGAQAQSGKPQLAPILLNDDNNDPKAVAIVKKLMLQVLKGQDIKTVSEDDLGEIKARYIPIERKGSGEKFIFTIIYDEPYGGCFNRGCKTGIFHSKDGKAWNGVFEAFIHSSFYDVGTTERKHANLIVSSNIDNSNPGVWMWNGQQYQLVN